MTPSELCLPLCHPPHSLSPWLLSVRQAQAMQPPMEQDWGLSTILSHACRCVNVRTTGTYWVSHPTTRVQHPWHLISSRPQQQCSLLRAVRLASTSHGLKLLPEPSNRAWLLVDAEDGGCATFMDSTCVELGSLAMLGQPKALSTSLQGARPSVVSYLLCAHQHTRVVPPSKYDNLCQRRAPTAKSPSGAHCWSVGRRAPSHPRPSHRRAPVANQRRAPVANKPTLGVAWHPRKAALPTSRGCGAPSSKTT